MILLMYNFLYHELNTGIIAYISLLIPVFSALRLANYNTQITEKPTFSGLTTPVNALLFGSIPLIIIGYIIFSTGLIEHLRNLKVIAWTTLIFGILLFIADRSSIKNKICSCLQFTNLVFITIIIPS